MDKTKGDTAIVVCAYTGGNQTEPYHFNSGIGNRTSILAGGDIESHKDFKKHMLKTILKYLSKLDYYLVLSTHSVEDEETQKLVNAFIYDSDNRWQVDGAPYRPNHGVAEMMLAHNAVAHLKRFGNFKYMLKLTYDQRPDLDYDALIKKYKATGKDACSWVTDRGFDTYFFSTLDFFLDIWPIDEIKRQPGFYALEEAFFCSITQKGMWDRVHKYKDRVEEGLIQTPDEPHHYSIGGVMNTNYIW